MVKLHSTKNFILEIAASLVAGIILPSTTLGSIIATGSGTNNKQPGKQYSFEIKHGMYQNTGQVPTPCGNPITIEFASHPIKSHTESETVAELIEAIVKDRKICAKDDVQRLTDACMRSLNPSSDSKTFDFMKQRLEPKVDTAAFNGALTYSQNLKLHHASHKCHDIQIPKLTTSYHEEINRALGPNCTYEAVLQFLANKMVPLTQRAQDKKIITGTVTWDDVSPRFKEQAQKFVEDILATMKEHTDHIPNHKLFFFKVIFNEFFRFVVERNSNADSAFNWIKETHDNLVEGVAYYSQQDEYLGDKYEPLSDAIYSSGARTVLEAIFIQQIATVILDTPETLSLLDPGLQGDLIKVQSALEPNSIISRVASSWRLSVIGTYIMDYLETYRG